MLIALKDSYLFIEGVLMQEEFETCNMSLFDITENNQITLNQENSKIDVVRAEFIEAETLSWKELFEGYNNLFAITYSSGIRFICKLLMSLIMLKLYLVLMKYYHTIFKRLWHIS